MSFNKQTELYAFNLSQVARSSQVSTYQIKVLVLLDLGQDMHLVNCAIRILKSAWWYTYTRTSIVTFFCIRIGIWNKILLTVFPLWKWPANNSNCLYSSTLIASSTSYSHIITPCSIILHPTFLELLEYYTFLVFQDLTSRNVALNSVSKRSMDSS